MSLKIKNRSDSYDINRPRPRNGHKYTKYEMCLGIRMVLCITQHLSNIWSSIHEKVKQHCSWVEKSVASKKRIYIQWCSIKDVFKNSVYGHDVRNRIVPI